MKQYSIAKYYNLLLLCIPFLTIYRSPISGIDLGSFAIILGFIFMVFVNKIRINLDKKDLIIWLPYVIYILVVTLVGTLGRQFSSTQYYWFRTFKFFIYILILLSSKNYLLIDKIKIYYINISLFITFFLYIQIAAWYSGHIRILGYIPQFVASSHDVYVQRASNGISNLNIYRASSFFSEPAHYAVYVIVAIIILLFFENANKQNLKIAIFLTVGIFLSTSGQGIAYCIIVWGMWFIRKSTSKKRTLFFIKASVFFLGTIAIIVFLKTDYGNFILDRIFSENYHGNAIEARSSTYLDIFQPEVELFNKIFGFGYGNVNLELYYPAWSFSLWSLGIFGTVYMFFIYYVYYFRSTNRVSKILVLMNAILSIFSTAFMSDSLLLWFSLVFVFNMDNCYLK